jgi:AraC-like DNA-binding protein
MSQKRSDPDETQHLCGAYQLERGHAHPFLRTLPDVIYLPARPGHLSGLRTVVDLLAADLSTPVAGAEAALPALLDLLLIHLLRAWLAEESLRRPGTGWSAALTDPAIATALHHIHRDPAEHWTVEDLAKVAGLSRTTFSRRFTTLVGQPPLTYLTWWRLNTGARLLQDGDATLAMIANQVGYSSEFAFANAFRREFGVAPGRYRRHHRGVGVAPSVAPTSASSIGEAIRRP